MDNIIAKSAQAFDSVTSAPAVRQPTVKGVLRSIKVYTLPTGSDNVLRLTCLAALTLCGKSTDDETKPWQTWIATLVCVAYEGMSARLAGKDEYVVEDLPENFLNSLQQANHKFETDPSPALLVMPPGLPSTTAVYTTLHYNAANIVGSYGYLALVIHLMGKRIADNNRVAIEQKRPENIIKSFKAGDGTYLLTGAGRMGRKAHEMVPHAWSQSVVFKEICVLEFATFNESDVQSLGVVALMFRMLEHSGMQGAMFCHKLVKACPWIGEIPILRPDLSIYLQSVEEYLKMDEHLRGYFKLIKGNSTKLFHSKSMAGLIGCAQLWLSQGETSVGQYTAPGAELAKEAFIKKAAEHGIVLRDVAKGGSILTPATTTT